MLKIIDENIVRSLRRFGQTVKHYPGTLCSCIGENNGVPKLNHTCNQGYYYDAPETIIAIRTAISYKYLNTPQGVIYDGGATFTIPRLNLSRVEQKAYSIITHGDILVCTNKTRRDTDILKRGVRDFIYAFDVTEILGIYRNGIKYDSTDYTVVEDAYKTIIGDNEIPITDENGMPTGEVRAKADIAGKLMSIAWLPGKGPEQDESYSVEFICQQQFKVWEDAGSDRGTDVNRLPKKMLTVLRRFVTPVENRLDTVETEQELYQ